MREAALKAAFNFNFNFNFKVVGAGPHRVKGRKRGP
jgi:hypothetical protein